MLKEKKTKENEGFLPVQDVPSPLYPALHVHVKLPAGVLVHIALVSQLSVPSVHSSSSKIQYELIIFIFSGVNKKAKQYKKM